MPRLANLLSRGKQYKCRCYGCRHCDGESKQRTRSSKTPNSVEASRVHALRRLLKPVLKINGRRRTASKSSYWLRIYVLITVAIAGIVIGLVSGFFTYLKLSSPALVTLQLELRVWYLAFIWPFVIIWFLPIAVFVAVFNWHRRETFKEWKGTVALADREVEDMESNHSLTR